MLALIVQGVWAAVLSVSGSYQQIFTDVIITAWIFYGLAVAAVLVLRRTQPQLDRPFRVPGYPWVPLLFCAAAIGLVLNTFVEGPLRAVAGIALIVMGLPVYYFLDRSSTDRW
jgi:APA family basic amino acid/polyamine antiporter